MKFYIHSTQAAKIKKLYGFLHEDIVIQDSLPEVKSKRCTTCKRLDHHHTKNGKGCKGFYS